MSLGEAAVSGKQIFQAHQESVAAWTSFLVDHEVSLRLLLSKDSSPQWENRSVLSSPPLIRIAQTKRRKEDPLVLFAIRSHKKPPQELEMKRRCFISLCFLLDELQSITRRIEDEFTHFEESPFQFAHRLVALISNLHVQLVGILTTKHCFETQTLSSISVIWQTLAQAMNCFALLKLRSPNLVMFTSLNQDQPQMNLLLGMQVTVVLKAWLDSAVSSQHVFNCVSLYLFLLRLCPKIDVSASLFKRILQVFDTISPYFPIPSLIHRRRCMRAQDWLWENILVPPAAAATFTAAPIASRCLKKFKEKSIALAFECYGRPRLEVAAELRDLVWNLLHAHGWEKVPLSKDVLAWLLLCVESLQHVEESVQLAPISISEKQQSEDVFQLLPKNGFVSSTCRSIAISLWFPTLANAVAEGDFYRALHRCCDTESLLGAFPELFDPLWKLCTQAPRSYRFQDLSLAFPDAASAQEDSLNRYLFDEIDAVLRTLSVKKSQNAGGVGFEHKIIQLTWLLHQHPSRARLMERKLAESWQELRTKGIERTQSTYLRMQQLAQVYFSLNVFVDRLMPEDDAYKGSNNGIPLEDLIALPGQYTYNLSLSFFMERNAFQHKFCRVMRASNFERAMTNPGWGTLPTVVNSVYQRIAKALAIFTGRLQQLKHLRRRRFSPYPFERALELYASEAKKDWTNLRECITEIGNLFAVVGNLSRFQPTPKKDYVVLLLSIFEQSTLSQQDSLKSFFLFVPALLVNFVDANCLAKDQVARGQQQQQQQQLGGEDSDSTGVAYFSDDGFVLGISALLVMLKQETLFESLRFFEGVVLYYSKLNAASPQDDSTFKMRHRGLAREHESILYSLASAKAFFSNQQEQVQQSERV